MSFSSPWALLGLLAFPRSSARTSCASGGASASRPLDDAGLLPNLVDRAPGRRRHLPVVILLVALAAMIVGVARPHATVNVPREEATVLLAMDVSRSMGATDITPTRLAAAQTAANHFVELCRRTSASASSRSRRARSSPSRPRTIASLCTRHSGRCTRAKGRRSETRCCSRPGSACGRRRRTGRPADLGAADLRRRAGRRPTPPRAAAQQAKRLHVPVYTILLGTPGGRSSTSCRADTSRRSACRRARRRCR